MLPNKQKPGTAQNNQNGNIEATWAESTYSYPERSDDNPAVEAATSETHQSATHVRISRKLKVKHERS
jgi:hypothetical protein